MRVISDMNAMQAELQAGRVDIAPMPTSLSPDAVKRLEEDPNLRVQAFAGSNVVLLTLNTTSPPLDNVKVRQAIAYAIDRQSMIQNLLRGYGKIAHSIIPEESWAYSAGQTYAYDPAMAKRLLSEAGVRIDKPVVYKLSGSSISGRQYAGVIQNYLKEVGIPAEIQTPEQNTLFDEALQRLSDHEKVRVELLPRNESQRAAYSGRARVIVPPSPLPGADLIAASDLVISAGGTINREAAALGVPTASIYAGRWAAIDEQLVKEGRLLRISSNTDLEGLPVQKKGAASPRRSRAVIDEIMQFIFE